MKSFILLTSFLIFPVLASFSQTEGTRISGNITDAETGKPLMNVNIVLKGSNVGTISDNKGDFNLKLYTAPVILRFSMVGYKTVYVKISELRDQDLEINLEQRVTDLPPATIYSDKVVNIIKDKTLYVADYEFYDDNILYLAYKNKMLSRPYLVYMTLDGDTISSRMLDQTGELYKDGLDYTHLVHRNLCYQIEIDSNGIELYYPTPASDFFKIVSQLDDASDDIVYIHQYYNRNQVLLYYDFSRIDSTYNTFRAITDEQGMTMLFDNDRWGLFGPRNEHELRFEEMCFADPVFAPLFILGDSIYIINFVDSQIEHYDMDGKEIDIVPIEFNDFKNIKEEILIDEASRKVYSLFQKNAITTLREIDLKTGNLTRSIQIPDYAFIENIKVRDDVVYFLYTERLNDEYKQLYKLRLN